MGVSLTPTLLFTKMVLVYFAALYAQLTQLFVL
jgi:hypothetical protein